VDLQDEIVRVLSGSNGRRRYDEVWGAVARNVGQEIRQQDFEAAVTALAGAGKVNRRSSGGGLDHLTLPVAPPPRKEARPTGEPPPRSGHPLESQLMGALGDWLDKRFRHSLGANIQAIVQDTAHAGPRTGVWSRPDFTVAAVRRFTYSTVRDVELHGFELKRADAGSVIGVHEALAHTRWVHYSYLVWHTPDLSSAQNDFDVIRSECSRHGIGLVTFADPPGLSTWNIVLEAEKASPDPLLVDAYIGDRFVTEQSQKLRAWLFEP
jgi:hypothetical protein